MNRSAKSQSKSTTTVLLDTAQHKPKMMNLMNILNSGKILNVIVVCSVFMDVYNPYSSTTRCMRTLLRINMVLTEQSLDETLQD
jgi:hypothetical protein